MKRYIKIDGRYLPEEIVEQVWKFVQKAEDTPDFPAKQMRDSVRKAKDKDAAKIELVRLAMRVSRAFLAVADLKP